MMAGGSARPTFFIKILEKMTAGPALPTLFLQIYQR
jgi:hypothetical protein